MTSNSELDKIIELLNSMKDSNTSSDNLRAQNDDVKGSRVPVVVFVGGGEFTRAGKSPYECFEFKDNQGTGVLLEYEPLTEADHNAASEYLSANPIVDIIEYDPANRTLCFRLAGDLIPRFILKIHQEEHRRSVEVTYWFQ